MITQSPQPQVLQSHEVDYEMDKIAEDERIAQIAAASSWMDLFKHANNMRYRTSVAVAVLFLQQCTGINAVFYFAPVIFNDFLGTSLALLCNLLLTAINFVR
jgi:Sugar (and other) transporter